MQVKFTPLLNIRFETDDSNLTLNTLIVRKNLSEHYSKNNIFKMKFRSNFKCSVFLERIQIDRKNSNVTSYAKFARENSNFDSNAMIVKKDLSYIHEYNSSDFFMF